MSFKEAVKTGIKAASVASLFIVPGCEVKSTQTVETFPQAATRVIEPTKPTRTPRRGFPDFVDGCFPVENEGFILLPDGTKQVSTGKKSVILLQTASGEYKTFFQGQKIPSEEGQLLKCRKVK